MGCGFTPDETELIEKAVDLARRLQEKAVKLRTPSERRWQAEFDAMVQNPADKAALVEMTDQILRPAAPRRAARKSRFP